MIGNDEILGPVPTGAVKDNKGVFVSGDLVVADVLEMAVHLMGLRSCADMPECGTCGGAGR